MNLTSIFDEAFKTEETYVIEEGLFRVSPAIAFFAFKDNVLEKIASGKEKIKDSGIEAKQRVEKINAKFGYQGRSDNDTVYKYTKEQKQVLAKIYRKYGPEVIDKINDFRVNVMAPYQVIKREVAKNYIVSDKTRLGMTKEEYYRYRESGMKKIQKKATYFKDADNLRDKQIKSRENLEKIRKQVSDFDKGIVNVGNVNIETLLKAAGLDTTGFNGYSALELQKTFDEIRKLEAVLKKGPRPDGYYSVTYKSKNKRTKTEISQTEREIKDSIETLREVGYSKAHNEPSDNAQHPYGSFKDALNFYILRAEKRIELRKDSLDSNSKELYKKVLKDSLDAAEKKYKDDFEEYMGLKGTQELNSFESKIWQPKKFVSRYTGDIKDWVLKIKPEDFKGVEYNKKSAKIIKAEKDIDRELKKFERELKKVMSDEDVALCKKYRLFNNFLTVKQLKNSKDLFKGTAELSKEAPDVDIEELEQNIISASKKDFDSLRDLEKAQNKYKDVDKNDLSYLGKQALEELMKRNTPNVSNAKKIDIDNLEKTLSRIDNNTYTVTSANEELKELNKIIDKMDKDAVKPFEYEISKQKDKLNSYIRGDRD